MMFHISYMTKFFVAKNSLKLSSLLLSFSLTFILELISEHVKSEELGISMIALVGLCFINLLLSSADFVTGVIAARGRKEIITSKRIGNTIGKYLGLILYLVLSIFLVFILTANYFVLALLYGPLILNIFKEFISIGENLKERNARKPYIFTVIDKVFEIMEKKFFKAVDKKVNSVDIDDYLNNKN